MDDLAEHDTPIEQTAYHEAGHAVVSVLVGLEFEYVTIDENGDALGHVHYPGWQELVRRAGDDPKEAGWGLSDSHHLDDASPAAVRWFEQHAVSALAGWHAEKMGTGVDNHEGREHDLETAHEFAMALAGAEETQTILTRAESDAERLLRENWQAVQMVAEALIAKRKLTHLEVIEQMEAE